MNDITSNKLAKTKSSTEGDLSAAGGPDNVGGKEDGKIVSSKIVRKEDLKNADCGFDYIAVGTQNFASKLEKTKTPIRAGR